MSEYRDNVLAAVHALRVDPFDEATRLILADLLEEQGRPGVVERCCVPLRAGWIMLNSWDRWAVETLLRQEFPMDSNEVDLLREFLCGTEFKAMVTPAIYKELWELVAICRDDLDDAEVQAESDRITSDRRARVAERQAAIQAAPKPAKRRYKLSELMSSKTKTA